MTKVIEIIVALTLLVFSFIAGVKYSDSVRRHASWLFEAKEEEVELPDLSSEPVAPISEEGNGESLNDENSVSEDQSSDQPADQQNIPSNSK
jgi:hypothetical protein